MTVPQKAEALARPLVEQTGCELVAVEYKREEGQMCLTVFIWSPEGVSLDTCETVSRLLEEPLEQADVTMGKPYCLCVSSPGDRPLQTERDFARQTGGKVEVLQKNGQKWVGTLLFAGPDTLELSGPKGQVTLPKTEIKTIRPYIGF